MRKREKVQTVSRLEQENLTAHGLATTPEEMIQAMVFSRLGEILQQLQEIQANSWMR